jgi:Fe2+ or Zn2+ uptake regulation protein
MVMRSIVMGQELKRDYRTTLITFNIQPTPARLFILKLICERFKEGFTLMEILEACEAENFPIGNSTIVFTIGLFKIHGLVKSLEPKMFTPDRKAGRPQAKFICILPPFLGGNN